MGRMKNEWDDDTQIKFVGELIEETFSDREAQRCDRRPFEDVDRQPDVSFLDESGAVSEYAYLLQPVEVEETFFRDFPEDALENVIFVVPHDQEDKARKFIDDSDTRIYPYRINCGLLQVFGDG